MTRLLTIGYGAVCYVVFLAAFLYAIGFVGNLVVPRSIDHRGRVPMLVPGLHRHGDRPVPGPTPRPA